MRFMFGDIKGFKAAVKGKNLVCFGAGKVLRNFMEEYAGYHLEEEIVCIADNRSRQIASRVKVSNAEIPVVSAGQMLAVKNMVILISCQAIYDVYMQLEACQELQDVDCWAANFIRSETNIQVEQSRWYPSGYRLTREPLIPKKIHYCWFGRSPIPEKNQKWMESWKKYCPDYEIIRWDEENYDITKNAYMYEAYKAGKWGFVPDYARLDIIYQHGGIYLDTDVELIKNMDELLYQKAFSGVDSSRNISLGLGFGAQAGCGVIRELRDLYETMKFLKEDGSYYLIAAPTLQRPLFQKKGYINNGEYQIVADMTVYPEKVLSAKCNWTGRILPTDHTFAIHHYDGSWTSDEVRKRIADNKKLFEELKKTEMDTGGYQ